MTSVSHYFLSFTPSKVIIKEIYIALSESLSSCTSLHNPSSLKLTLMQISVLLFALCKYYLYREHLHIHSKVFCSFQRLLLNSVQLFPLWYLYFLLLSIFHKCSPTFMSKTFLATNLFPILKITVGCSLAVFSYDGAKRPGPELFCLVNDLTQKKKKFDRIQLNRKKRRTPY